MKQHLNLNFEQKQKDLSSAGLRRSSFWISWINVRTYTLFTKTARYTIRCEYQNIKMSCGFWLVTHASGFLGGFFSHFRLECSNFLHFRLKSVAEIVNVLLEVFGSHVVLYLF